MVRGYSASVGSISMTAATAKTVMSLIPGAAEAVCLVGIQVNLDTATLCFVELMESTQATNGTAGSALTVKQVRGFVAADTTAPAQITVYHTYTSEPTALTLLANWRFNGPGPFEKAYPLGREYQSLVSGSTKYKALVLRVTSTATAVCGVTMEFEPA